MIDKILAIINAGEIVSIIGPNGAGKSTVLKAVSGLLPLWQGEIFYESISIKKNTTAQNIKRGLTYCPQGNRVFDEMSVLDNLEIGGFNLPRKCPPFYLSARPLRSAYRPVNKFLIFSIEISIFFPPKKFFKALCTLAERTH